LEGVVFGKRVALVVEGNTPDARLVEEHLGEAAPHYRCVNAVRLADAIDYLDSVQVDVVLLDADLPDCRGPNTVTT